MVTLLEVGVCKISVRKGNLIRISAFRFGLLGLNATLSCLSYTALHDCIISFFKRESHCFLFSPVMKNKMA
jgi:hypothetical protein